MTKKVHYTKRKYRKQHDSKCKLCQRRKSNCNCMFAELSHYLQLRATKHEYPMVSHDGPMVR